MELCLSLGDSLKSCWQKLAVQDIHSYSRFATVFAPNLSRGLSPVPVGLLSEIRVFQYCTIQQCAERRPPFILEHMQWLLGAAQAVKEVAQQASIVAGRKVQQQRLLADGGFAYVYAGFDVETGEQLAIRRVLLQDKETLHKANVEIELLNSLCDHPHVVRFLGAEVMQRGAASEAVYLFELCTGGTLLAKIEKAMAEAAPKSSEPWQLCPCLSEDMIVEVLGSLAQALAYLSRLGLIHYDVKSENVLLGADNLWKLGDFGSASEKSFDLEGADKKLLLEAQEFIHGRCTPMYRAPEIADVYLRWKIGPKVDMFALGCVLFATMTAQHPFAMESTCANITASYRLPEQATAYPPALRGWLRRLLAREPAKRPSAVRLAAEVERFRILGEDPNEAETRVQPASKDPGVPVEAAFADFATFAPSLEPAAPKS